MIKRTTNIRKPLVSTNDTSVEPENVSKELDSKIIKVDETIENKVVKTKTISNKKPQEISSKIDAELTSEALINKEKIEGLEETTEESLIHNLVKDKKMKDKEKDKAKKAKEKAKAKDKAKKKKEKEKKKAKAKKEKDKTKKKKEKAKAKKVAAKKAKSKKKKSSKKKK